MIVKALCFAAAFAIGICLAIQPSLNAEVARHAGHPIPAAMLSLVMAAIILLPFAVVWWAGGVGFLTQMPWWAWLGGIAGATFVLGGVTLAPIIGLVAFFGFVVFGQIVGSALIDHFGAFQMAVRPIGLERAVAIVLVLSGVVLFLRAAR